MAAPAAEEAPPPGAALAASRRRSCCAAATALPLLERPGCTERAGRLQAGLAAAACGPQVAAVDVRMAGGLGNKCAVAWGLGSLPLRAAVGATQEAEEGLLTVHWRIRNSTDRFITCTSCPSWLGWPSAWVCAWCRSACSTCSQEQQPQPRSSSSNDGGQQLQQASRWMSSRKRWVRCRRSAACRLPPDARVQTASPAGPAALPGWSLHCKLAAKPERCLLHVCASRCASAATLQHTPCHACWPVLTPPPPSPSPCPPAVPLPGGRHQRRLCGGAR